VTAQMVHAIRTTAGRSQKLDAHSCPRKGDHRATRPGGRVEYGYNTVQEIGGGTVARSTATKGESIPAAMATIVMKDFTLTADK
jgi:hypothetical protein